MHLRFDAAKARASQPGPGAYDESNRNNFVAQLAKKRFSRGGNFGSTSKRFVAQVRESERVVCVGDTSTPFVAQVRERERARESESESESERERVVYVDETSLPFVAQVSERE